MNVPPPPKPPSQSRITLSWDKRTLRVQQGFNFWSTPALGSRIQTDDATGQRITLTRAATIGLFALGAKKRTGHVSVVVTGHDGQWTMIRVPANKADKILNWAFEWNIWSERTMPPPQRPYPPYSPQHPGGYPPPQPYYPPAAPGPYPPRPGQYPPSQYPPPHP